VATMFALVALTVATLLPAYAHATTVRLGPEALPKPTSTLECIAPCPGGHTFAQLISPGVVEEAPAAGVITSWRVTGSGAPRLRVLRPAPEGEWIGDGTSAGATNVNGEANATSLPIRAGDVIGVDLPSGATTGISFREIGPSDTQLLEWKEPALADNGVAREASEETFSTELVLNADVTLTPVVFSVSPGSGSSSGGNPVTISGRYLDGATGVSFGSTPASSFSVDFSSQITAIAPPGTASTVDVHVTGPGGSSEAVSADKYTFTPPAAPVNPAPKPLIQGGPNLGPANPAVTGFSESATKWRRGHSLPRISSVGAPVGTTFSFSLNEPATATFTFTQSVAGRRAHGRCVAPSHGNAHKPRCKRTVTVGSFAVSGKAGLNKVRFQGRPSSAKTLKPGSYLVSLTAREAHGLKVVSRSLSFTIVS
jgi:IPT/TIG domain